MKRQFPIALLAWLLASIAIADCCAAELSWQGCGISKKAFMEACAIAYERQTGTRVRLTGGTTELGIEATASGAADLGGASRHLLPSDGEAYNRLSLAIVGWDALAVVVHPSNPLNDISRDDLMRVYQQRYSSWSELGGPMAPLLVVDRQGAGNDVDFSFAQLVCRDCACDRKPSAIRLPTSLQVEDLVERQPLAIAVTGISSARKRRLKVLSINGVLPTVTAISEGEYPYYRPFYVSYRPGANAEAERFVAWMLSDQGQRVLEEQGTVSLRQGSRLIRDYAFLPPGPQICNLDSLRQQSLQVFANQAPE